MTDPPKALLKKRLQKVRSRSSMLLGRNDIPIRKLSLIKTATFWGKIFWRLGLGGSLNRNISIA